MADRQERQISDDPNANLPSSLDALTPPLDSPSSTPESPSKPPPTRSTQPPLSVSTSNMTSSSTPLGNVNAARRPAPQSTLSSRGGLPPEMEAKMRAFHLGRQGAPQMPSMRSNNSFGPSSSSGPGSPTGAGQRVGPGGIPSNFRMPPGVQRPSAQSHSSSPAAGSSFAKPSLAAKRGMQMPGGLPGSQSGAPPAANAGGRKKPGLSLSQMNQGGNDGNASTGSGSLLDKYSDFIDSKTGTLKFKGKATLTNSGVEFAGGKTFNISLDEVDTLDELGKGNYGTVYKVRHSRPRMRRPGLGLAGNKALPHHQQPSAGAAPEMTAGGTSGVVMAMKEIRLELDDAKFAAIIMELDILHRCISPYIVDFYGAFFQEGAVYICMEFMDGGSIDKLYADGIDENVLRKIAFATTQGLKSLKEDHNIIHRDVKPTNILVNTRGQIKICDFGVSGNLVASIAKTNIGCQSYMAPERISSGGVAQAGANPGGGTYSVQSDIWSLGLTLIECALGQYPYPPETYDNIFSQLSAIVDGEPPDLPADRFSEAARNFVSGCLMKIPKLRPTYAMLLQHAWLAPLVKPPTITEEDEEAEAAAEAGEPLPDNVDGSEMPLTSSAATQQPDKDVADWVASALEKKRNGQLGKKAKPALHAAPLDAVPTAAA